MSNDKHKLQQFHFDLFKQLYCHWCADGQEKHEYEQKPDFLIIYPDKTLGVEHTELFMDKGRGQSVPPQKREGSLCKIVDDAKSVCENHCIPPLEVKLWFSTEFEDAQVKIKKANQLSQQLAEFVEKEFRKGLSSRRDINEPLPEISQITITPGVLNAHTWLTYHSWTKCAAGESQTEFIEELQRRIDDKNNKYKAYIDSCDECWLLIVTNRRNPAQNFDIDFSGKVAEHTYQSKFSKTFYLEVTHKRLVKLKTIQRNNMVEYDPNHPTFSLLLMILCVCVVACGTAGAVYLLWRIHWVASLVAAVPVWILLADLFVTGRKSACWYLLDFVRHIIAIAGVAVGVRMLWNIYWLLGIIAAWPILVLLMNLVGFLTLPLYHHLTPEGRAGIRAGLELRKYLKRE
ncbi:MAG: hypothetical protein FVQ85_15425 [Planctomycetes bacterium]|nr:hypothetical protein [Planctomycetota bacterium]